MTKADDDGDVDVAGEITNRRVLGIAIPIMLANVSVPILGAVDTGVVGQLGEAAPIAAVGVGAIILSSIYWIFGFLRMGTVGLTSQAAGAKDHGEVAALLIRSLMIGVAGGIALIALQPLIFAGAFWVSPASIEVETLAAKYMTIRIWSAPAAIATFGITGWLIAQERARAVLILQLLINGLNLGMDLWFVLGLGWGVEGVAYATFGAEWVGLAVGLWLCRGVFLGPYWRDWLRIFDTGRLRRMAVVNTDIFLRSMLLQGILVSFLLLGGRFGDVVLAANQVLLQFLHIAGYAMDGFAFAAEALVGQAFGAGAVARLRRVTILTSLWATAAAVVMSVVFWGAGGAIIDMMATSPEVRIVAREFLPWMIASPILMLGLVMFDGVFIGATRSGDMRNMMAVSTVIYGVAVVGLIGPFGNHGLWAALLISFIARGVTLGAKYPELERAAARMAR